MLHIKRIHHLVVYRGSPNLSTFRGVHHVTTTVTIYVLNKTSTSKSTNQLSTTRRKGWSVSALRHSAVIKTRRNVFATPDNESVNCSTILNCLCVYQHSSVITPIERLNITRPHSHVS